MLACPMRLEYLDVARWRSVVNSTSGKRGGKDSIYSTILRNCIFGTTVQGMNLTEPLLRATH